MKVSIIGENEFMLVNKQKPTGKRSYQFEIGFEFISLYANSYSEAKKQIKQIAKELGSSTVKFVS